MDYAWDSAKDAINRRKHALCLADGIAALEDPDRETWIDETRDYGEERLITLGRGRSGILLVVTVEPFEDLTRIISVRRAERHEREIYHQAQS